MATKKKAPPFMKKGAGKKCPHCGKPMMKKNGKDYCPSCKKSY